MAGACASVCSGHVQVQSIMEVPKSAMFGLYGELAAIGGRVKMAFGVFDSSLAKSQKPGRYLIGPAVLMGVAVSLGGAFAQDETVHKTQLNVSLSGLPIGVATFDIRLSGNRYELSGKGKTAGIAQIFSPGRGGFTSSGQLNGSRVHSRRHTVFLKDRKEQATLAMTFAGDKVDQIKLNPDKRAKRSRSKRWVPILPKHTTGVIDPASSLVVPVDQAIASDPKKVCDRTFEIFDGESRYDMRLSFKKVKAVKTKGYQGKAFVCKLKYIPIAGHKTGRKNIERMRKNENMEIWLAPIAGSNIFTFIRIEVGTWIGRFSAVPKYFGAAGQ